MEKEYSPNEVVRMEKIEKRFGGVTALNKVDFSANGGEIHALLGENGAGKSTLMKILAGAIQKDAGKIFINGREVSINSPKQGQDLGISVIYQEFALAKHLTAAENIFIDNLGEGKRLIDWKRLKQRAASVLTEMGFGDIDVSKPVS
jgi:ribose transport system ATP-binding protein